MEGIGKRVYLNLWEILYRRRIKVKDFSRITDIPPYYLSHWKRGKSTPKLTLLLRMAERLRLAPCPHCGTTIHHFIKDRVYDSLESQYGKSHVGNDESIYK